MEVMSFSKYTVAECDCCGELLIVNKPRDLDGILDKREQHLGNSPECREWYAAMPTLDDLLRELHNLEGKRDDG